MEFFFSYDSGRNRNRRIFEVAVVEGSFLVKNDTESTDYDFEISTTRMLAYFLYFREIVVFENPHVEHVIHANLFVISG